MCFIAMEPVTTILYTQSPFLLSLFFFGIQFDEWYSEAHERYFEWHQVQIEIFHYCHVKLRKL